MHKAHDLFDERIRVVIGMAECQAAPALPALIEALATCTRRFATGFVPANSYGVKFELGGKVLELLRPLRQGSPAPGPRSADSGRPTGGDRRSRIRTGRGDRDPRRSSPSVSTGRMARAREGASRGATRRHAPLGVRSK